MGYPTACTICGDQGVRQSYLPGPIRLKASPFLAVKRPKILFVGQDPTIRKGEAEMVLKLDRPGQPLYNCIRGRILDRLGLALDEVAATNAVKCTFPNNRVPNDIARDHKAHFQDQADRESVLVETAFLGPFFENCKRYLIDEIQGLRPRVLVSLGQPCHQLLVTAFGWPMGLGMKDVFGSFQITKEPFNVTYVPCVHQPSCDKEHYKAKWPDFLRSLAMAVGADQVQEAATDMESRTLRQLVEKCEEDTARIVGQGAANRLAKWRRYAEGEEALIEFVQRVIRGKKRSNGWLIDQKGGLSLERIVLDHVPELFTEEDKREERSTLGI